MTIHQFQKILADQSLADRWWVAVEGEVNEKPMRLVEVMAHRKSYAGKEVEVAQVEIASQGEPEWLPFDFDEKKQKLTLKATQMPVDVDELLEQGRGAVKRGSSHSDGDYLELREEIEGIHEDVALIKSDIETIHNSDLETIRSELDSVFQIVKKMESMIEEATDLKALRAELDQRERYVVEAEERLMSKTLEHDEREATLEQLSEDLKV